MSRLLYRLRHWLWWHHLIRMQGYTRVEIERAVCFEKGKQFQAGETRDAEDSLRLAAYINGYRDGYQRAQQGGTDG